MENPNSVNTVHTTHKSNALLLQRCGHSQSPSQAIAAGIFQINTSVATFCYLVDSLGTRILKLVKDISAKLKSLSEFDRHASGANRLVQHQPTQNPTSEELSIRKIKFKAFDLVIKFIITNWEYAESIVPFLQVFSDATIRVSGTLYVTSDMHMKEVFAIGRFIRHSCDSVDFSTMSMVERMTVKYEKYWDNPDLVNILLLIAIVLNPMQKIEYVNYFLDYLFGEEKGGELKSKLSKCIKLLYQQYQSSEEASEADTQDIYFPLMMVLVLWWHQLIILMMTRTKALVIGEQRL
ncbi:hypothetical protein Ahy_A07g035937 isoform A [Arachis hypogaea]|uniref:hAT-like transposase RNase-H fold domain-containing protein n=1 Tax=Arachis hypogaea TaxID=3818 RepID=A0A445CER0_ARAHY|nr:hypothetical protein Ahy_A07g035937 isoform A [Arachis hypogaea]